MPYIGLKKMLAMRSNVLGHSTYRDDMLVGTRLWRERGGINTILDLGCLSGAERVIPNSYRAHGGALRGFALCL